MKKWILRLVILSGALVIIGLLAAILSLNILVKSGVEKVGPMVTKTEVKLDSANISPFSGMGELKGFFVGNPTGFKTPSAIKVGGVKVAVDTKSVLSPVVVVDSVVVNGAEVTLEVNLGSSNLGKLLENIDSVATSDETAKTANEKPAEGGKKFKVKDILITGTKVNASAVMMQGEVMTKTLPEIHLTNIGTDDTGVTAAELSKKIVREILASTIKETGKIGGSITLPLQAMGKNTGAEVQKTAKGFKSLFRR